MYQSTNNEGHSTVCIVYEYEIIRLVICHLLYNTGRKCIKKCFDYYWYLFML